MFHVALFRPEIPPNTGNIMRLCANTGCTLHLIHPLGFDLEDARLRRAGLDYREWAAVREHEALGDFISDVDPSRLIAFTRDGDRGYAGIGYRSGDALLFGPESDGLPDDVLDDIDLRVRIPMLPQSRSLNLANAVAIVVYEAWRQNGFAGGV